MSLPVVNVRFFLLFFLPVQEAGPVIFAICLTWQLKRAIEILIILSQLPIKSVFNVIAVRVLGVIYAQAVKCTRLFLCMNSIVQRFSFYKRKL